jgi:small-conductance mechanosensitive channel
LHGAIFLVAIGIIVWARRKLRKRSEEDSDLKHALLVFEVPVATALVLSLVAGSWIYPQAPRLLWAILGAAALIPAVIVLRRIVSRPLFPILNVLVAFYFVDQLRSVAAAPELMARGLFLLEMLLGVLFLIWFSRRCLASAPAGTTRWRGAFRAALWIATVLFSAAFLADAFGYGTLSKLLGNATLTSAYLALILYAAIRILDGLILSALTVQPLGRLGLVQRHRSFLQNRARQILEWAAIALWAVYTLEAFSLRAPVFQDLRDLLTAKFTLGSASISLGDTLLFAVTIWVAYMVSRLTRFILDEEVYPHINLAPGLRYSISRMAHYAILVAGFLIAIALLGFNLTRLTILAGAVGVGLGFGLQNIINNFVSGIILLFERPVKVGDVIQIDSTEGVVTHIGIRASIVRTTNGPEIIVPNGKLISDPVTNWTFSRRQRLITIPVSVVPGVEAQRVLKALMDAAAAQTAVIRDPPAKALFVSFAGGALNFELRVWTDQINDWMQIRSDLSTAINSSLIGQNISIK